MHNARVVVATNQDIQALQESRKFHKDLYYRLCGHQIHIPPLRDRREDLPVLLDHFLEKASETLGKKKPTPPRELLALLATYPFPGNIRELQFLVLDAVSSHKSAKLSMEVFKSYIRQNQSTPGCETKHLAHGENAIVSFSEQLPTLRQTEQLLIVEAMKRASGNQAIASQLLGITRQALNKRLKQGGQ